MGGTRRREGWSALVGVVVVATGTARASSLPWCPASPSPITIPVGTASIPDYEYWGCDKITGVTFNTDGALEEIGWQAFQNADGLTEVTIPTSVTHIGGQAFALCSELARVVFDTTDGPSKLESIDGGAFFSNDKLETVEIPESVTEIGIWVLYNCPQLNRVIAHGSSPWTDADSLFNLVESLCDRAGTPTGQACIEGSGSRAAAIISHANNNCNLASCPAPTTTAPVTTTAAAPVTPTTAAPVTPTAAALTALPSCPTSPSPITIPNGTVNIPDNKYFGCVHITGVSFNTDGALEQIGAWAFFYSNYLAGEIVIPASVTIIREIAFSDTDITGLSFEPDSSLQEIGNSAFQTNDKLEVVEIPESVTLIGTAVFDNCPNLNRVLVYGSDQWNATSLTNLVNSLCDRDENYTQFTTGQACIEGSGSRATAILDHADNSCNLCPCSNASCLALTATAAPVTTTTTAAAPAALPSCPGSPSPITIPNGTTSIPGDEYFNCNHITGVTFNTDGALKEIGGYAFYDADGLTETTIPASVTSIGSFAFASSSELARVVFDTTGGSIELESIGNSAFYQTAKLEVVEIPESVTSIGEYVLDDCPLLDRVIVHGSSPWTDPASLSNLVVSLCNRDSTPTGQACIEGSGSRATAIINHADNNCNLCPCSNASCLALTATAAPVTTTAAAPVTTTATPAAPPSPPSPPAVAPGTKSADSDTDDPALGTGAIVGIAVGGAALLGGLVWYLRWQSRQQIVAQVSRATTRVGELIF